MAHKERHVFVGITLPESVTLGKLIDLVEAGGRMQEFSRVFDTPPPNKNGAPALPPGIAGLLPAPQEKGKTAIILNTLVKAYPQKIARSEIVAALKAANIAGPEPGSVLDRFLKQEWASHISEGFWRATKKGVEEVKRREAAAAAMPAPKPNNQGHHRGNTPSIILGIIGNYPGGITAPQLLPLVQQSNPNATRGAVGQSLAGLAIKGQITRLRTGLYGPSTRSA